MRKGLGISIKTSSSYEQLDTFKDENITIKEAVKDFADLKKVFTAMSKTFTVPASKKNNKILKHFYRNDIVGVDARALIDAKLTLGDVDYRYGNVSIEEVKFKDNEPNSYTIRFYGNLTELNKNIGEDELTDLDFSAHDISSPNWLDEFRQTVSTKKPVAFPLMSRNRRFISHSGDHDYTETEGLTDVVNLTYSTSTRAAGYYGLVEQDLVGAIFTGSILDAIEDKYGVNFTGALKDADYIRELRLLLLKRGGDGLDGSPLISKQLSGLTPVTYNDFSLTDNSITTGEIYEYVTTFIERRGEIVFQASTTATNFKVHLKRNGETIETVDNTDQVTVRLDDPKDNNAIFTFEVEAAGIATVSISGTMKRITQVKTNISTDYYQNFNSSVSFTGSDSDDYLVRDNLPTMKVIDFLSDIFKRFNIVATVDKDLNVDTKHFDAYINQGNKIDISKYVDVSQHKIGRPNFHSGIRFTTEPVETIGEYGFQKVNGRKYGELKYNLNSGGNNLEGKLYKIDLASKMIPIDQPTDLDNDIITNFQSMILVDKKGEDIQLAPTFFYTKIQDDRYIAYDNGSIVQNIDQYIYIPSEVYYEDENQYSASLGEFTVGNYFSAEPSVILAPDLNFKDANLFNAFYYKTVSVAFNETSRRAQYEAYLPIKVLHTLSTADTIVVANKVHLIESYSTNFLTGKTSFNLIQIDEATANLFRSRSVVLSDSNSRSASYMDATTGLAKHIFTDNSASYSVIGGESGVFRLTDGNSVSDNNIGTLSMIGDSRFTNHEIKTAIEDEVTVSFVGSTSDGGGGLDDAIGGDTSSDLAARWSNVPNNANYYLWHFGTNDSGANNLTNTMNTLSPLMSQLLTYGGKVVYVRQIPRSDSNEQFCRDLDDAMIGAFGSQFHAVIDARATFEALDDPFNTHYSDHVHLNSTGNALFGQLLGQNLN